MKTKLYFALLICWAAASALQTEPAATLIENDQVKVVRALEKPHVKSPFHEHARNRVMVYLQPGRQRFEYQDGRTASVSEWKEGSAEWSPAGGMHSAEALSGAAFNIIEIELKSAGSGKAIVSDLDPVKLDPKHYSVELENAQVRVIRGKFEGHAIAPMHEHAVNRVTVFLTDQDFRVTDQQGKVTLVKHKAGEAIWGTPIIHKEENLSDQPFEVIAVELK